MLKLVRIIFVCFTVLGIMTPPNNAEVKTSNTYQIDTTRSFLEFNVKHLTISSITGGFTDFQGVIEFNQNDLNTFLAQVNIKANSIDTRNKKRDDYLKSTELLDVNKFPEIIFQSKKLTQQNNNSYIMAGDLTIHGVTKKVWIPVVVNGPVNSSKNMQSIGIEGEITISRKDFEMNFDKTLDSGEAIIGDDINIFINIEAWK